MNKYFVCSFPPVKAESDDVTVVSKDGGGLQVMHRHLPVADKYEGWFEAFAMRLPEIVLSS